VLVAPTGTFDCEDGRSGPISGKPHFKKRKFIIETFIGE
jgi:hypothetical protein